jgi:hypothetical protein
MRCRRSQRVGSIPTDPPPGRQSAVVKRPSRASSLGAAPCANGARDQTAKASHAVGPAMAAASSSVVIRRGPCCRCADWCPTTCRLGAALARPQSASEMSAAAVEPGRVRPCHSCPGKARGCQWPGPVGSDVILSDSDAIRVRIRAWGARPCPSGEAEGSRRDGPGRAPLHDGCGQEVAAGGGLSLRGDVFKWSKFGAAVAGRCAGCAAGPARGS